ncbi:hypothetical protein IQ07DRAFT_210228 [Pyrenochaeta sp. DS3sAY3a]|nr:hypothetical protein IQ07DRAFT_210228 [Pyrenochaeta sp. DS3sAY3a]
MNRPASIDAAAPTDAEIDQFIARNSVLDNEWDASNTCCLCLESFNVSGEPCHRMTVAGCSHHFGRDCLFKLFKIEPMEEKKCPLCRTVWQAPLWLNRPTLQEIIFENETLAAQVPVANPPPSPRTSTGSAPAGNRITLESDPNDNYATRLENYRRNAREPDRFVFRAERRANERNQLQGLDRRRADRALRPAYRPTEASNDGAGTNERANTSNNGGVLEGLYFNAFSRGENTNQQRDSSTETNAPATDLLATLVNEGSQLPRTEQTPFRPHAPESTGPSVVQSLGESLGRSQYLQHFPLTARALEETQNSPRQPEGTSNRRRADGQGPIDIAANLRARRAEFDRLSARYDDAAREHAARIREGDLLARSLALDRRQHELDNRERQLNAREMELVSREAQATARFTERSTRLQNSQHSLIARLEDVETEIQDIQTALRNSPPN